MQSPYLGSRASDEQISSLLTDPIMKKHLISQDISLTKLGSKELPDEPRFLDFISSAISNGSVVGYFEGRMEWGLRALGHRSILGDPRRADMKDILNNKIKDENLSALLHLQFFGRQ